MKLHDFIECCVGILIFLFHTNDMGSILGLGRVCANSRTAGSNYNSPPIGFSKLQSDIIFLFSQKYIKLHHIIVRLRNCSALQIKKAVFLLNFNTAGTRIQTQTIYYSFLTAKDFLIMFSLHILDRHKTQSLIFFSLGTYLQLRAKVYVQIQASKKAGKRSY